MTAQLERLIEDSNQLQTYIEKVKQKGRSDLVSKLCTKQQFLNETIDELRLRVMQ